jgi:hypothetical protein
MRRTPIWTVATVAVLALALALAGIAVAAKPTVVRVGNVVLRINGGVSPEKLPKRKLAPIALRASGKVSTVDGSHPPAAKTVTIDFDKQGTINARGLAKCNLGRLVARDTRSAKAVCRKAIVGKGGTTVEVEFPEQAPFFASGPLVLFNGGVRGRVTTMYIHAYVAVPAPTALITVVKIRKIRKGRYGTRAVARIPRIAGGSGSLRRFELVVKRRFKRNGRPQSYLLAKCAKGRFFARATTVFSDRTRASGTVIRRCRVRR